MIDFSGRSVTATARQTGIERITVPAGEFSCYRMEVLIETFLLKPPHGLLERGNAERQMVQSFSPFGDGFRHGGLFTCGLQQLHMDIVQFQKHGLHLLGGNVLGALRVKPDRLINAARGVGIAHGDGDMVEGGRVEIAGVQHLLQDGLGCGEGLGVLASFVLHAFIWD